MPHRLQLQELAKKTADCSNNLCRHARTHAHTARFRSKRIRCSLTYTHKPPWLTTHNTHTFQSLGAYLWAPLDKPRHSWILLSGQIRYRPSRLKKVAWFCCKRVRFHHPYESETNTFYFEKESSKSSQIIWLTRWVKFLLKKKKQNSYLFQNSTHSMYWLLYQKNSDDTEPVPILNVINKKNIYLSSFQFSQSWPEV